MMDFFYANEGLMVRRMLNMEAFEREGQVLVFHYRHRCAASYRPLTLIVLHQRDGEPRVDFLSHWPAAGERWRTFSGSHGHWSLHSWPGVPATLRLSFSWNGIFGQERTLMMTNNQGGAPNGTDMWEALVGIEVRNSWGSTELQMHQVQMWLSGTLLEAPDVPGPPPAILDASPRLHVPDTPALDDSATGWLESATERLAQCRNDGRRDEPDGVNDMNNNGHASSDDNMDDESYWM